MNSCVSKYVVNKYLMTITKIFSLASLGNICEDLQIKTEPNFGSNFVDQKNLRNRNKYFAWVRTWWKSYADGKWNK